MRAWAVEYFMSNFEIVSGPFAGNTLDLNKLQPWRYASGSSVIINGQEKKEWPLDYLTPVFLSVFDPLLGWGIESTLEVVEGLRLPDFNIPLVENGQTVRNSFGADVPSLLQVVKASASLIDPSGKVIHTTHVLQGVSNLYAADLATKKALLQLYRGMGLPSSPDGEQVQVLEPETRQDGVPASRPIASTLPMSGKVRAISVVRSNTEGEEAEDVHPVEDDSPLGPPSVASNVVTIAVADLSSQDSPAPAASVPDTQGQTMAVQVDVDNSHIDARVLNQLKHFATLAGEKIPALKDDAEARKMLVRLRTSSNRKG